MKPSQTDLIVFDSNPIQFVRAVCDIKPSGPSVLGCFEDEILAVIEGDINTSEWLIVKNAFNSIGRIQRTLIEPVDERQLDEGRHDLLSVPRIKSSRCPPSSSHVRDPLEELVAIELKNMAKSSTREPARSEGERQHCFMPILQTDFIGRLPPASD